MATSTYITHAGTELVAGEIDLIAAAARTHGRVSLLVPSYAEGEVCRRGLANAGVGTGVDVVTPAAWLAGLWELCGDGRGVVGNLQRRLLVAQMLADEEARDAAALAPLKNNPGSVAMLSEMARDYHPYALPVRVSHEHVSRAEWRSITMLDRYAELLDEHGLVELSTAADELRSEFGASCPPCARAVVVRGVPQLPEYLLRLLESSASSGELVVLYNERQRAMAQTMAVRFNCSVQRLTSGAADDAPCSPVPSFAEVAGPTARLASYAQLAGGLAVAEAADAAVAAPASDTPNARVTIVAQDPLRVFRELSPRLAAFGLSSQVETFARFDETRAGQAFFQLIDFLDRVNTREPSAWWPAPDIVDWLRSPFSGIGPAARYTATSLDTQLRKNRSLTKESLFAQLDSLQSREQNRERARATEQDRPARPVVCKDVIDALDAGRYARALQLMHDAAAAMSPSAFGVEGRAAQVAELSALQGAYDVFEQARDLRVSGASALVALKALSTRVSYACGAAQDARGAARIWPDSLSEDVAQDGVFAPAAVQVMRLDELAAREHASFDAVLFVDADAESYPLIERDTVSSMLAAKLGCAGMRLASAARQRDLVTRALQAARTSAMLAYVGHDNAAEKRFPALFYEECRAAAEASEASEAAGTCRMVQNLPGEGALFSNLDTAGARGTLVNDEPRQPEHVLPDELTPYVLLGQRTIGGRAVTRTLSASQVENYLACPYRWFVNSRVTTRRLDVEFGPIERGNFSHDVMQRFYERLAECGLNRVTPETLERCHQEMDIAFDEMRDDHLHGRYTHGKYATEERPRPIRSGLVPLDELERSRIEAMRASFHEVVRHDAQMLMLYEPVRLEYSFDKQGVTYAGYPLGGRIDRIDVAPDAGSGKRFVVIDYKTGASVADMACPDPTMQLDEGEELGPDWLPGRERDRAPKVQTLMYATALERMTGGQAQGAVYYGLRGPSVAGAVASALTECEPPAFPDDKLSAFPGKKGRTRAKHDGTLGFSDMLDRVEHAISQELDRLRAGDVAPRPASDSCSFCPLTMCEKRR